MGEMTTAREDSNALRGSGDKEPNGEGNAMKDGFTAVSYPSQGPVTSQSQVVSVSDSKGSMGNEGTSRGAYEYQPDTIDAKNPKAGKT